MKKVTNKLRVLHYPQIPCTPFFVDVKDEEQAYLIRETLANQHLFLFDNNMIDDCVNALQVVMWDENADGEGNPDWVDYYNEAEDMEFDEIVEAYFENDEPKPEDWDLKKYLLDKYTLERDLAKAYLESATNSGSVNDIKKIARISENIRVCEDLISELSK